VNRQKVTNLNQLKAALNKSSDRNRVLLLVNHQGQSTYIVLQVQRMLFDLSPDRSKTKPGQRRFRLPLSLLSAPVLAGCGSARLSTASRQDLSRTLLNQHADTIGAAHAAGGNPPRFAWD